MAARSATLPARILELLATDGPSYGTKIAEDLGARPAAVAGALSTLRARHLVDGRRSGRRVIFTATAAMGDEDPPLPRAKRAGITAYLDAFDAWLADPTRERESARARALAALLDQDAERPAAA